MKILKTKVFDLTIQIYVPKILKALLRTRSTNSIMNFNYSTATLAGLFNIDKFDIKRIIKEGKQKERSEKLISKNRRDRILKPHHIQNIKSFVDIHILKYFNCRMIKSKAGERVKELVA